MLGDRHDLDMREAHVRHVVAELDAEFAVGQRPAAVLQLALPRAQMHFVHRHGPVEMGALGAPTLQPSGVIPLELARLADNRRIARRRLEVSAVGIGLDQDVARLRADFELVEFTG